MLMTALRSDMLVTLQSNYIAMARARGIPPRTILVKHALKPSSLSLLTLTGIGVGQLVSGAVVVESIFVLPGLGTLMFNAVLEKDLPVVQGVVIFVAAIYVVLNTGIDALYHLLDPHVSRARRMTMSQFRGVFAGAEASASLSSQDGDDQGLARTRPRGRFSLWLAIAWLLVLILAAALVSVLPVKGYAVLTGLPARTPPFMHLSEPLGTDIVGRSMTSRLLYGARQSLMIGLISVSLAAVVGSSVGLTAGYLRGKVDGVLSIVLDALLSFPALILLLAIASVGARSSATVIIGLAILLVAPFPRVVRANTLALAEREFVLAARQMGAGQNANYGAGNIPEYRADDNLDFFPLCRDRHRCRRHAELLGARNPTSQSKLGGNDPGRASLARSFSPPGVGAVGVPAVHRARLSADG